LRRSTGKLTKIGGDAKPSTLMFAKLSPDRARVGYVRENNLYVEPVDGGPATTKLTNDGSSEVINGTFDWVYEEEFDCRDGWRWSPDSKRIAFWQVDATRIRNFLLINNTDSLYSFTIPVEYPKVGQSPSPARIGVVDIVKG